MSAKEVVQAIAPVVVKHHVLRHANKCVQMDVDKDVKVGVSNCAQQIVQQNAKINVS